MSRARDLADSADKDIVGTLTVDALTVDGDVGIGTNSPSNFSGYTTLDVVNATNGGAILARGSTVEARFVADDPTGTVQVKAQSNHPLMFATSGTERMRIDSSGNIGIGTSSTAANLHVYENTSNGTINNLALLDAGNQNPSVSGSGVSLDFRTNSGTSYFGGVGGYSDGTNYVAGLWGGAAASGAPDLAVTSSGNVGIGTTTVDSLLHLSKFDATAYSATETDGQVGVGPTIYLENSANADNTVGGQIVFGMRSTEEQARISATGGSSPALTFGTADAERMRINSSGNVGIGTSSPSGAKLDIFTGSTTADGLKINRYATGVYYSTLRQDSHGLAIRVGDGSAIAERVAITPNGLTFNGDTAAANALDDYEEGTFTPSFSAASSHNAQIGRYTKIGNIVSVRLVIDWSMSGSSSGVITGLPFAVNSSGGNYLSWAGREWYSLGTTWAFNLVVGSTATGTLSRYDNSQTFPAGRYGISATFVYEV